MNRSYFTYRQRWLISYVQFNLEYRIPEDLGFRVQGSGFKFYGLGFRVLGFRV